MFVGRMAVIALTCVSVACTTHTDSPAPSSPEHAVHRHIAAAKTGDVEALRSGACGELASAMKPHTDDEVRRYFMDAYAAGPDVLSVESDGQGDRRTVTGYFTNVTDRGISFTVENRDGWKVCEIREDDGEFWSLPGPFRH